MNVAIFASAFLLLQNSYYAMNRRNFLKFGLALGGTSLLPVWVPPAIAAPSGAIVRPAVNDFWERPRYLWLHRRDTGETVKEVYWADGKLVPDGYHAICRLLRDIHENKAVYMDTVLLDVLRGVSGYFENISYNKPLIIQSGYRTEKTNNSLIREGAKKNSMHLRGRAVDFSMEKIDPEWLARLGVYFQRGGVGLYNNNRKRFVHLDTGNVKVWKGA